ncbi:MAG: hypothetical protein ACRDJK_07235 [Actinomycetota bacterium]
MQAVHTPVPRAASHIRRIDMRVVVGVALMLFAIIGTFSLVRRAQARIRVLVGARQVEPGEVIKASDLRVADLSTSGAVAYLPASQQGQARVS